MILQQISPDFCIEVVRQFRLSFNVVGGDLCNDEDDSQALLHVIKRERIEKEVPCSREKS